MMSRLNSRKKTTIVSACLAIIMQAACIEDGGATWELTYDDEGDLFPSFGIYQTLDGFSKMYFLGKKGCVTKWE
jgi:hypothetical protein